MDDGAWDGWLSQQVRESGRMLLGVAQRMLRESGAAEDVCQIAYAKAWEQRERLRETGSLRAWLTRVVVNESLVLIRRRGTERRGAAVWAQRAPMAEQDPATGTELRDEVAAALEQLPEETRTVVVLRLMNGLSGNEAARVLGCSAAEVSRQLHGGMERLREILA